MTFAERVAASRSNKPGTLALCMTAKYNYWYKASDIRLTNQDVETSYNIKERAKFFRN